MLVQYSALPLYSKPGLKRPLKKTKNWFWDRFSLNAGQKYCRMLQESILLGWKIALVRLYLRVPQAAGQVEILIFLVKIKLFPLCANNFCDAGQRYFKAWFCNTFDLHLSLRPLFCLFLSGGLRQVLLKCMFGVHRSEPCYKRKMLQRSYRKMTIKWSFSYNSFVKFHGKKIWEP